MKLCKSTFEHHVDVREKENDRSQAPPMKWCLFNVNIDTTMLKFHLFWMALILATIASTNANAQTSEVFEIKDPEVAYQRQCDAVRDAFKNVASRSANWDAAEKAIKALAADPANAELKKKMVAARAPVIEEMLEKLRHATQSAAGIDQAYKNHVNQLDGEIADSVASIANNERSVSQDTRFLTECLTELVKIEKQFPNNALVSTGTHPEKMIALTEQEQLLIAQMEAQISAAEQQLEINRNARTLNEENVAALAEMKIEAAREFLAIRKAVCRAKLDQVSLAGVARNDLSYLNLIETKERLAAMRARKAIEFPSISDSSIFRGGYQFDDDTETKRDRSTADIKSIASKDRIDRLRRAINQDQKTNESNTQVANATERKSK